MRRLFILLIVFLSCGISAYCQQKYHDAAMYDLRGNVKCLTENETSYNYTKEGMLEDSGVEYTRNSDGYIVKSFFQIFLLSRLEEYSYSHGQIASHSILGDLKSIDEDDYVQNKNVEYYTRNEDGKSLRRKHMKKL